MSRRFFVFALAFSFVVGSALSSRAAQHAAQQLTPMELLGKKIYEDKDLSLYQNQSCKTCHHPIAGFADISNLRNPTKRPVSKGSDGVSFGGRNAPTAAYAGFSPPLSYVDGLFIGGLFWDGRASGLVTSATATLGAGPTDDPLADQAKGPFLNPIEMALPDAATAVSIVKSSDYAWLFEKVFGPGAFTDVGTAYNNMAIAIAKYERSSELIRFSSRFDLFVAEQGADFDPAAFGYTLDSDGFRIYDSDAKGSIKSSILTPEELDGLALFNSDSDNTGSSGRAGGMCYACHLTEKDPVAQKALFTDFSYDNLGIPVNPRIAVLAGPQPIDYGLGDKTRVVELQTLNSALVVDADGYAVNEIGKFKVSTLRNIGITPPYGHNGYFATLQDIVHFYNVAGPADLQAPPPEVDSNVNRSELGNLGLSLDQEAKIVAFLLTLTDN